MNTPALLLKPRGAALSTHGTQRTLLSAIQRTTHKQIMEAYVDNPIQRAIFISQTAKNTGAHLQQPNSEAHEADDRCYQVSLARRLMLAHPAAALATNNSPTCPNVSAAKRVCSCPIDTHQLHCIVCKSGGGVDQRHSALARCLADLVTTHTGAKVHIEQTRSAYHVNPSPRRNLKEHAWTSCSTCMDTHVTSTRRWLHLSQPTRASSQQPAPAQATWQNVRKRKSSTDTHQPGPIHP